MVEKLSPMKEKGLPGLLKKLPPRMWLRNEVAQDNCSPLDKGPSRVTPRQDARPRDGRDWGLIGVISPSSRQTISRFFFVNEFVIVDTIIQS